MAKKKRGQPTSGESEPARPQVPEKLASPFASALLPMKKEFDEQAKKAAAAKAAPPPPPPPPKKKLRHEGFHEDDATAISLAMQGVKPLEDKRPGRVIAAAIKSRTAKVAPFGKSNEQKARERLDTLVAQDVRFRVLLERDYCEGSRMDAPQRISRELARRTRASETLDLHGRTAKEASDDIVRFVKRTHKLGLDVVCIVHGKGQHSEGGQGVLRDEVVRALTDTFAATLVLAFVTAPDVLGGSGALLVELRH